MPARSARRQKAEADALNAFRRIVRALRIAAQRAQNDAGISAAQLYVLAQLADGSARSIKELAEQTLTDRSSVGAVVARLVERGMVGRARAANDRRRAEVRITKIGVEALRHAPAPPTRMLVSGLEALEEATLVSLAASLGALVDAMGLTEGPAEMLFDIQRSGSSPRRGARPRA